MTLCSKFGVAAISLAASALAACTSEENLGDRDGSGSSTSTAGSAAKVTDLCTKYPDHRLNWKYQPKSPTTSDHEWVPAPGQCAALAPCLDGSTLDPGVVARAVECLSRDVDKAKTAACSEDEVTNAAATRETVTAVQTACSKKRTECNQGNSKSCVATAVLDDETLARAQSCFDKPCDAMDDCLEALLKDATECIEDLF